MDPQLQKDLKKIENELTQIRRQSSESWGRTIFTGMLHGAGWVAGTILAFLLLGWILSILGIVPGLGEMTESVQELVEQRSRF